MSIDEREDEDEEQEVQVEGLPIVVSNEVIDSYGSTFSIFVGENNIPGVSAGSQAEAPADSACSLS